MTLTLQGGSGKVGLSSEIKEKKVELEDGNLLDSQEVEQALQLLHSWPIFWHWPAGTEGSEGHFTFRRTIHTRDTRGSGARGRVGRTIASTAFYLRAHWPLWVFCVFCYYLLLYLLYLMHELFT